MKKILLTLLLFLIANPNLYSYKWELLGKEKIAGNADELYVIDKQVAYAIVTPFTVCRTSDGGSNWEYSVIPQEFHKGYIYSASFLTDQIGFLCLNNTKKSTILKTTDGAKHWTELESGINKPTTKIQFIDEQYGVALGTKYENGTRMPYGTSCLYCTEDGGKTWTEVVLPTKAELFDMYAISKNNIVCIGAEIKTETPLAMQAAVWTSKDNGRNWTKAQLDANKADFTMAISFAKNGTGLAGMNDGSLYKTTDFGNTWSKQSFQFNSKTPGSSTLSLSFVDNTFCTASDLQGALTSADAGNTWNRVPSSLSTIKKLQFTDPQTGFVLLTDYNIKKTTDGGKSFSFVTIENKINKNDILFIDQNIGIILSGQPNPTIERTEDGGVTWQKAFETSVESNTTGAGFVKAYRHQSGKLFALGSDFDPETKQNKYFIYSSSDNGKTWAKDAKFDVSKLSRDLLLDEQGTFWTNLGNNLYRSNDLGENWTLVKSFTQFSSMTFSKRSNAIWAYNSGSRILVYSSDNGFSWKELSTPLPFLTSVYALGNQKAVIYAFKQGVVDGTLYQTDDGGAKWRRILESWNPYFPNKPFVIDENNVWMAVGGESLLNTTDGGQTWGMICTTSQEDESLSNNQGGCSNIGYGVSACYFLDNSTGWALGSFVTRYRKEISTSTDGDPASASSPKLFPIPCEGSMTISFGNCGVSEAAISVFGLLGNEIVKESYYRLDASGETDLNLLGLASGCYILKTRINGLEKSIPFLVK